MNYIPFYNLCVEYSGEKGKKLNGNEVITSFQRTSKVLSPILETLKKNAEKGIFTKDETMFVLLKTRERISLFVGVNNKNNPYIFLYMANKNLVTNCIPHKLFEKLADDFIIGEFKHKISQMGKGMPIDKQAMNAIIAFKRMAKFHYKELDVPKLTRVLPIYVDLQETPMTLRNKTNDQKVNENDVLDNYTDLE